MKEVIRKSLLVLLVAPTMILLGVSWYIVVAPLMSALNWLICKDAKFIGYMKEVQSELLGFLRKDAKKLWIGKRHGTEPVK